MTAMFIKFYRNSRILMFNLRKKNFFFRFIFLNCSILMADISKIMSTQ